MCEIKTNLVCSILLVTASSCKYRALREKKVGQHSDVKIQNPCENEYKIYCLNGGECYHLIDEGILGCIFIWFFGEKRCEK